MRTWVPLAPRPGVGLPCVPGLPRIECTPDGVEAAVDPDPLPADHIGGTVQVGVDRGLVTGCGVEVDGEVDGRVGRKPETDHRVTGDGGIGFAGGSASPRSCSAGFEDKYQAEACLLDPLHLPGGEPLPVVDAPRRGKIPAHEFCAKISEAARVDAPRCVVEAES